jgi:excisionase family DNA binding protein
MTTETKQADALLLSAKEAAKALGISTRTLHTLTADNVVPSVRIGRRRLYSRTALVAWVAQQAKGGADHA